jgi:acyl-CoA thioesterase
MVEDVIARSHQVLDTLSDEDGHIGLSALQTLRASQPHAGPFARLIGINFQELSAGQCTATLIITHHLLNPFGIAHGGIAFALADSVCGGAAVSVLDRPRVVTQDMQIRYHGPARPGKIVARAEVIHHGQRTITTQCKVHQGELMIASATATFAILSDSEIEIVKAN